MVTKLHNRSKQSHFPAHLHQLSLCLLSMIGGQLSINQNCQLIRTDTHSFRLTEHVAIRVCNLPILIGCCGEDLL